MTATTSWRDHIKIHPATELLPRMDKRQLAKLAEDIRRNGLLEPITTMCVNDKEMVVDGVNRLDAMASLGWNFLTPKGELCKTIKIKGNKNIHRRHLTSAQKRELVAKLLKLDASKSNRQIAKLIGADHETVAAVRAKGEAGGKIYHLAKTKGADGKEYPARKPAKPRAQPPRIHRPKSRAPFNQLP